MRMKRRLLAWILVMAIIAAIPMETVAAVKVTKVTLNRTSVTLTKGKSFTLTASVSPKKATKKTVKWTSSNKKVATVTSKGVVKGVAKGTAVITAKAADGSGKKASCKITVKAKSIPNVSDKVLMMKYPAAARYLGLTKKGKHYWLGLDYYVECYVRKGRKPHDGSSCLEIWGNERGHWNLNIVDKTISFQGIRVGMSEAKAKSILKKKNWQYLSEDVSPYSKAHAISYTKEYPFTFTDTAYLDITFVKGKVRSIGYAVDGD